MFVDCSQIKLASVKHKARTLVVPLAVPWCLHMLICPTIYPSWNSWNNPEIMLPKSIFMLPKKHISHVSDFLIHILSTVIFLVPQKPTCFYLYTFSFLINPCFSWVFLITSLQTLPFLPLQAWWLKPQVEWWLLCVLSIGRRRLWLLIIDAGWKQVFWDEQIY